MCAGCELKVKTKSQEVTTASIVNPKETTVSPTSTAAALRKDVDDTSNIAHTNSRKINSDCISKVELSQLDSQR